MKTKLQKQEELRTLESKLPKSEITVFTTFAREGEKGLNVAQMQEFKRALREMNSEYVITKKSLVDIAAKDLNYDGIDVYGMQGSVGVVLGPESSGNAEEAYAVTKKIYEFAKKYPALRLFGAWFNGMFLNEEKVMEMAKMPSKLELVARLLGMLTYPVRSLAIVLDQIAKTKPAAAAPVEAAQPQAEPAPAEAQLEPQPEEKPADVPTNEESNQS
ncbi:MAG: 50S ribosomal protein L10 [Candidatus Yanofskybacteria bacterium]|nr:50S ribosomal protein L10 [Candidatus Yanofskybacteria bacterium]